MSLVVENTKNSHHQSLIIAGGFAAVTSSIWLIQKSYFRSKHNKKTYYDEGWDQVRLSPLESSFLFEAVEGISTLTWYEGDMMGHAHEKLKDRVMEMCTANPWLLGRLIRNNKNGKSTSSSNNDISMVFPPRDVLSSDKKEKLLDDYLFQALTTSAGISREDTPYEELPKRLKQLGCLVGPGSTIVDKKDECIFKIRLIPDCNRPTSKFALVVSLAHCVGDGHTFYQLYNMLSSDDEDANNKIQVLDPVRKPSLNDDIASALGGKEQADFLVSPPLGFIFRFVKGIILSTLFGPPTKVELFWINDDWIQMEKERAINNKNEEGSVAVNYVSTNDIVTARFFKMCDIIDQGTISINFRGKILGCESNMAGNYFNFMILRPGDWDSPAHIRSSIQEIMLCKNNNNKPKKLTRMSSWEHLISSGKLLGATSNWTTFCKPVYIENCQQDLHIPVIPCDSQSVPARVVTGMYLFRPQSAPDGEQQKQKHKIAAMFAGPPSILETLKKSGMVGPSVL